MAARELKLYNSLSRKIEALPLPARDKFGFYLCGPTVYGRAHIGNFRTMVCADLLVRTLKALGYPVRFIRNITDVDDKTIKGSHSAKLPLAEFTSRHIESFEADCKTLALVSPDLEPRATLHIGEMIALIEKLLKKGHAYRADDGSVYFKVESFRNYGCLSHLDKAGLKAGARVAQDEYEKESVADFVLWKKHRPEDGDVQWDSPWGPGRPGWHLECSAMSMKYLGETYDLHGGGVDLLFPHHENEIAQSEAATGKPFVRHWWHVAHLLVDGRKMSKSLGNLYTLDDIRGMGFGGNEFGEMDELRYLLLSAHYRDQLNFTPEGLKAAREAVQRLRTLAGRLHVAHQAGKQCQIQSAGHFDEEFFDALANNLNISEALGCLFTAVRELNTQLDKAQLSAPDAQGALSQLKRVDQVLGLRITEPLGVQLGQDVQEVAELVKRRDLARAAKNFSESDRLRDELMKRGFNVKDTPGGTQVERRR